VGRTAFELPVPPLPLALAGVVAPAPPCDGSSRRSWVRGALVPPGVAFPARRVTRSPAWGPEDTPRESAARRRAGRPPDRVPVVSRADRRRDGPSASSEPGRPIGRSSATTRDPRDPLGRPGALVPRDRLLSPASPGRERLPPVCGPEEVPASARRVPRPARFSSLLRRERCPAPPCSSTRRERRSVRPSPSRERDRRSPRLPSSVRRERCSARPSSSTRRDPRPARPSSSTRRDPRPARPTSSTRRDPLGIRPAVPRRAWLSLARPSVSARPERPLARPAAAARERGLAAERDGCAPFGLRRAGRDERESGVAGGSPSPAAPLERVVARSAPEPRGGRARSGCWLPACRGDRRGVPERAGRDRSPPAEGWDGPMGVMAAPGGRAARHLRGGSP
jgi:hypothetical protein